MILTEEQRAEFERKARPLIEWLNDPKNAHPHCTVIVDSTHAEFVEGVRSFTTHDYLRD